MLAAWQLTYIFCSVPCGGLLDRFGPRRMMFASVLVIAASVALRGLASDYVTLLLAVMVFGLGGPLISSGAPKVVSLWFTGKERGLAMGIYFTGNATGGIVAVALTNSVFLPAIGGDWRDLMSGYALFIVAVGAIWLAISAHPASRDMEARLKAEEKRRSMDVFLELVRDPIVRLVLLLGLFILFYNHGMNHWLPDLLRSYGMTPSEAGYWAAIPTLFGMVASLSLPRMATPDKRFAILLGLFVCAAVATILVWAASGPLLAVGLVLTGDVPRRDDVDLDPVADRKRRRQHRPGRRRQRALFLGRRGRRRARPDVDGRSGPRDRRLRCIVVHDVRRRLPADADPAAIAGGAGADASMID